MNGSDLIHLHRYRDAGGGSHDNDTPGADPCRRFDSHQETVSLRLRLPSLRSTPAPSCIRHMHTDTSVVRFFCMGFTFTFRILDLFLVLVQLSIGCRLPCTASCLGSSCRGASRRRGGDGVAAGRRPEICEERVIHVVLIVNIHAWL